MLGGWQLFWWGLAGGLIVDGLEFYGAVRASRGRVPAAWKRPGTHIAEVIRISAGGALAVAFGASNQISGEFGALAVGAAAPLIVEKLGQQFSTGHEP